MPQTVVPVSQVANSPAWSPSGGGSITPLLSDGSDVTMMNSPSSPDLATWRGTMGNPAGPPRDNNGHACVIRCKRTGSGGFITVNVYSSGGTLAATLSTSATITTSFQTLTIALTSGQAATAGFNGLQLEVVANQNGFGSTFMVSELSFQFSVNDQTVTPSAAAAAADATAGPFLKYDQFVSPSAAAPAAAAPALVVMFDQVVSPASASAAAAAVKPGLSRYRTIDQVLADPRAKLDVVLEMHGALRTDPALADQTFYFSYKGRRNDSADSPAGANMPPYLTDPGGVDFLLGSDLTLAGGSSEADKRSVATDELAGSPQLNWKQAELKNERGQVDWMALYTWAGRTIRAWVGQEGEPFRGYSPLYTGSVLGEPLIGSENAQVQTAHPVAQMDRVIPVNRWVGIPVGLRFLTGSGTMSLSSSNPAFALQAFTVVGRYRLWSYPASGINLIRRSGVGGNWLTIQLTATSIVASDTVGGSAETPLVAPITPLDEQFHTIVYGRNFAQSWYLMVDGVTVASGVPVGANDYNATWGFTMFEGFSTAGQGEGLDLRIYGQYYEPSEASSLAGGRVEGTEENLVALWRCDDGLGNTVTDYAGGFNATLGGTSGTDFAWNQTNLGEAALAGQPIPQLYGLVANAKAQLIDGGQVMAGSKPRLQYTDVQDVTVAPALRSQGVALALTTDYSYVRSAADRAGVLQIVGAASQPFTFESKADASITPTGNYAVDALMQATLARCGVTNSQLHAGWWSTLHAMLPYAAGYVIDKDDVKLGDWLSTVCQGLGFHHRLSRDGRIAVGSVLPPVSPGPFGGPALEFTSPSLGVQFPATAGSLSAGSHTVGGWFTSFALDLDPAVGVGSLFINGMPYAQSIFGRFDVFAGKGFQLGVSLNPSTGSSALSFWHSELTPSFCNSTTGVIKFGQRYFLAGVFDATAHTVTLYMGQAGGTLQTIGTQTGVTGTFTGGGANGPSVGANTVGSVSHAFAYSAALSRPNLQSILSSGPQVFGGTSPSFWAHLDDGHPSTQALESVSGTYGQVQGLGDYCRWAPKFRLELDRLGDKSILTRSLVPAWSVAVQAATNYYQMKDAEVLTSVAAATALALKGPGQSASWTNQVLFGANREALSIVLSSVLRNKPDAQKLLRNLLYRYADGHGLVAVPKVDRRAAVVELTDEVWVTPRTGREALLPNSAFRVVGSKPDLKAVTADLTLWR